MSDPCAELCVDVATICCVCAAADACARAGGAGGPSCGRVSSFALGVILLTGIVVGSVFLARTQSYVCDRWTGQWHIVSNARYIPVVVIFGGIAALLCFGAAVDDSGDCCR